MIRFDSGRTSEWRHIITKLARDFEECEFRLGAVINGMDMEIAAREAIDTRLNALKTKAKVIREGLEAMAKYISDADSAFTYAESQISGMIRQLTEEWRKSERKLAPVISRARVGLNSKEAEQIDAMRALDGLFMSSSSMDFEHYTAYFKPLNIKFEVLPDDIDD